MDKAQVISLIRAAFRATEHPGDAFLQGSREGCELAEVTAPFMGVTHWTEIDSAILDPNEAALSFFSEGGFRHFLPAFLIADLQGVLQTADPVFHLTHGFSTEKTVQVPVQGRVHSRSTGRNTFVNPRRYGAMTWYDHALRRLSIFPREEAAAIVAYLEWKRDHETFGVERDDINAALKEFWYKRSQEAPTQAVLVHSLQAEAEWVRALSLLQDKKPEEA